MSLAFDRCAMCRSVSRICTSHLVIVDGVRECVWYLSMGETSLDDGL